MILAGIVFFTVFLVILLCVGLGLAYFETRQRSQIRQMLNTVDKGQEAPVNNLMRPAQQDDAFAQQLARLPVFRTLETWIEQSLIGWTLGRFLILSLGGSLIGAIAGSQLNLFGSPLICLGVLATVGLVLPLLIVLRKRSKTMTAFEKQFPEALDFLSRSMRAGHGFSISLEILAHDSAEPLATALRRVSHEMQLGAPLNAALGKMIALVPLVDVRFFVSSVLLQQETGGNLSEILNKLSYVIRERFRLRGQVRALAAHGRITGMVLLLMPVAVTMILLATSPEYLMTMVADKDGRLMIYGAIAGQVVAYFVINKIVDIKV